MTNITCLYPDREAVIVACLYGDLDAAERVAFETHVTTCSPCRTELGELRGVRSTLAGWAPPEPARTSFLNAESRIPNPQSRRDPTWWHTVPVWAQVAAAMLVFGVSASIANLDIRYDRSHGLEVRTGWSKPASVAAPQTAQSDAAPWRAELAALQTQLRSEMREQTTTVSAASMPAPAATMSEAEFRRRAGVLLDESERRQQNELALRLAQLQTDVHAQQQAEVRRVNQHFRDVTDTYGDKLLKQQLQINYLLPVSQGK